MSSGRAGRRDREPRRFHLAACGTVVTVEIGEPALLESARRLFQSYESALVDSGPARRPDVTLERTPGGCLVVKHAARVVACGSELDALAELEITLTGLLLRACRGYAHLHAAGAVVGGRAVLALGGAGGGKSSLALCWAAGGFPVLGDDVVLLTGTSHVLPFKRMFKVSPAVLEAAGIDPATTPFWYPGIPEAWYGPEGGPGWAEEGCVAAIAEVRHRPGSRLCVEETTRAEGLNMLLHSLMPTGLDARACFEATARVAEGARVFRVLFGSAVDAASELSGRAA